MKKDILFVINNLNCGGAEKALISLLEEFDYEHFNVDLFLFKHEGIFMKNIPSEVNLLPEVSDYKFFDMSGIKAVIGLIRQFKFKILINRIKFKFISGYTNSSEYEQMGWKYISSAFPNLNKRYDTAIGYLEKNPIYYVVEKVDAKIKIGWIHSDYRKLGMSAEVDDFYFSKLNYIFTVSKECSNVLINTFPQYKSRIRVMHNVISSGRIKRLSNEQVNDYKFENSYINIISVGRLSYIKGFDIAIKACKILVNENYPIRWIILGDGEERSELENLIIDNGLDSNMFLLGVRDNPYSYINKADIYVQPSRSEGWCLTINEAKILKKPIVTTNFKSVKEQVKNNINGIITNTTPEDIAIGIKAIIKNPNLRNDLINNLQLESGKNPDDMSKLYDILEINNENYETITC